LCIFLYIQIYRLSYIPCELAVHSLHTFIIVGLTASYNIILLLIKLLWSKCMWLSVYLPWNQRISQPAATTPFDLWASNLYILLPSPCPVTVKSAAVWDVTPCSPVDVHPKISRNLLLPSFGSVPSVDLLRVVRRCLYVSIHSVDGDELKRIWKDAVVWSMCSPVIYVDGSGRAIAQASHRGGPGSSPSHIMWDLWLAKWHWGRFSPSISVSPANSHSTNCSTFIMIYHPGLVQ
jgi:hypothetical protein